MAIYVEERFAGFIFMALISVLLWYFIQRAEKGILEDIRRLPVIDAIDEAIGRAVELGKPVLMTYSFHDDFRPATLVGLQAVSYVSKLAAEKGAEIFFPVGGARTYPIAVENYRLGTLEAGHPEVFDPNNVIFLSNMQFAYTSGTMGLMETRRPGAAIFLGPFWVEGIHFGVQKVRIDTFGIGGVESYSMGSFMYITMDYTVLGSELYATGAYMSEDPPTISGIATEDVVKWLICAIMVVGVLLKIIGSDLMITLLTI
jgi:hypothetical protein